VNETYTVEINNQWSGTVEAIDFNHAAMAVLWETGKECDTMIVTPTNSTKSSALYIGVTMSSPLNLHCRRFLTFRERTTLDKYLAQLIATS
jgi:hypothetical protein